MCVRVHTTYTWIEVYESLDQRQNNLPYSKRTLCPGLSNSYQTSQSYIDIAILRTSILIYEVCACVW
jgi:hypothetical protein